MKAGEFGAKFDAGEDISEFVDWLKMQRPGRKSTSISLAKSSRRWTREAQRLGVTRQALVKLWVAERLGRAA